MPRISIECRETSFRVVSTVKHGDWKYHRQPWKQASCSKLGKMRVTEAQLLFAPILISRVDGRVYWTNQTVKCSKIIAIAALLSALNWKLFQGPHSIDEDWDKDGNHSVQHSERRPTSAKGSRGSHLIHKTRHLHLLNPLPSMSDQERISSYNIISIFSIEVMRIKKISIRGLLVEPILQTDV